MDTIRFWKMHALGNDYIIIDNRDERIVENEVSSLARKICQRRFSIGADGLLLIVNSESAAVRMRVFNADGSEAEMCGNGIRCVAKYCYDNQIVQEERFIVETLAGLKSVQIMSEDGEVKTVRVGMGKPFFDRSVIPMCGRGRCIDEPVTVNDRTFRMTCLSVGNPHCVIFLDNIKNFPVEKIGPLIERHSELFPNRVNVEFVQVLNREKIQVRVWERGVGETLACGTGAAAAAVACKILGKCNSKVLTNLRGGNLTIEWDETIFLSGPVEKAFEGIVSLR